MLIGSITRASGSSSSGVAWRLTSVPSWRRIPLISVRGAGVTGVGVVGGAVRGSRRVIVTGRNSRSASPARNAATAAGVAGIVARSARSSRSIAGPSGCGHGRREG